MHGLDGIIPQRGTLGLPGLPGTLPGAPAWEAWEAWKASVRPVHRGGTPSSKATAPKGGLEGQGSPSGGSSQGTPKPHSILNGLGG